MILAGNHISNLDPIFKILAARRQVFYLAKEEHFKIAAKKIRRLFKDIDVNGTPPPTIQ